MFVMTPSRVIREAQRGLEIKAVDKKEPNADYSVSRHTVEVPLRRATFLDDRRKVMPSNAKVGDRIVLEPKCSVKVVNRVIEVEVNPALYVHGIPSFKRLYRHGENITAVTWECTSDLDVSKLPWLYEIYIHDQAIK